VIPEELEPLQNQANNNTARLDNHGDLIADLLARVAALENGQPPQPSDVVARAICHV